MKEMWKWIGLIAGIILGLALMLPTPQAHQDEPATVSVEDLLEEWDLQDHLEELEEEE